ncbi:MAG TPA: glycosyl hydrolase 53 family protein [Mucilaginibacter sp.]
MNRKILLSPLLFISLMVVSCTREHLSSKTSTVINAPSRHLEYLGGCMSVLHRIELIPGRSFQDINGTQVDPIKHMAGKGFKSIRIFVSSDQPLTNPAGFPDNTNADYRELNYMLDMGGISEQVNLALRAKAAGMKVVLTLQFGQGYGPDSWGEYIPKAWLNLTYTQMLTQLDTETRRLLTPFLDAGIQPDIIIVENEADSGMLYQYQNGSGSMAIRNNPSTDVFSNVATGIYEIWPKCAGYFKRVILSAKAVIKEKGMNNDYTRFSVHTTTNSNRIRSTYDRVFDQPDINETNYVVNGVDQGVVSIIPADIRNTKLKDLVDIMGASVYPAVPASGSAADITASLSQFNSDWGYVGGKITSFGRWTSGPYNGQFKKQGLVVEYALGSVTEDVRTASVKEFLNEVCNNYPWVIGALWWEPEYAHNNWYGSTAELYYGVGWNTTTLTVPVFKESPTLSVWGSY